ncbi:MAG TPA: hypothetical protein VGH79_12300 [Gaiellaceae bacterium]|jgi:hypothetical protein
MRAVLAGTFLAVTLAVAGCGGGSHPSSTSSTGASGNGEASKSAQKILVDAANAASAATSVHIAGKVLSPTGKFGSGQIGNGQIALDLKISEGVGATGSITLGGQKVDLVIDGPDGYMKAPPEFWAKVGGSTQSTLVSMFGNKWVKFSANTPQFSGFKTFTNTKNFFTKLTSGTGTLTNTGTSTYQGQSVVSITSSAKPGTIYIAAEGKPYPVAIVSSGATTGALSFTDWNTPVTITAPSGAIDFTGIGG